MHQAAQISLCLALAGCGWPVAGQGMRVAGGRIAVSGAAQVIRVPASQVSRSLSAPSVQAAQDAAVSGLLNGYPAPGLGFDYAHHSAVNRNLATRALIDPLTQQRLAQAMQARRSTPLESIAIPLAVNNIQIVVVIPPPVVILPVADEAEDNADHAQHRRSRDDADYRQWMNQRYAAELRDAGPAGPAPPLDPPREVSELVLICRDGTLVFAVGYTRRGDHLIYVTREGHRKSLALEALDLDATRAMNESLGTTLIL